MEAAFVVTRALSALKGNTGYQSLGKPVPLAATSWPSGACTDCSGFIAWCLRLSRRVDHPLYVRVNGGWFETTAIHRDGMESTGFFVQLDSPRPGALLVYPDYNDPQGAHHEGHIGLVLDADGEGIAGAQKVIHCSLGNYRGTGEAIQVTGPQAWLENKDSILVWLDALVP